MPVAILVDDYDKPMALNLGNEALHHMSPLEKV